MVLKKFVDVQSLAVVNFNARLSLLVAESPSGQLGSRSNLFYMVFHQREVVKGYLARPIFLLMLAPN